MCRTRRGVLPTPSGSWSNGNAGRRERDGFQWYCENCDHLLYEEFAHISDIEKQLPPIFEHFFSSIENRTCKNCGTVQAGRANPPGRRRPERAVTAAAMKFDPSLAFARSADETDPLRAFRSRFAMPRDSQGRELLYFAGHSLGVMPLAARDVLNRGAR